MTTETMREIEKTSSSKGETLDSNEIKSIQLSDGWHNVKQCQVIPFAVSNSPVYSMFPTLKYKNESGQTVYTPLKQVLGFSREESKYSQS